VQSTQRLESQGSSAKKENLTGGDKWRPNWLSYDREKVYRGWKGSEGKQGGGCGVTPHL